MKIYACAKIEGTSCAEPAGEKVRLGSKVSAFMIFMLPQNGNYDDLTLQWTLDGKVRTTRDLSVKGSPTGSLRYRMYYTELLSKPGTWVAKLTRGNKDLGSFSITVE